MPGKPKQTAHRSASGKTPNRWNRITSVIQALPVDGPIALATFSVVAMLFLVIGKFYTWPILLFGLAAIYLTVHHTHRLSSTVSRPGTKNEQLAFDLLVVAAILVWTLGNIPFAAQKIYTDRDPATYGVTGVWLIDHTDLHIPRPAAFANLPQIAPGNGGGFGPSLRVPNEVFAQGAHLLPALVGLGGRIVGRDALFRLNILIGAVALLAVYGFGRLIMKPRWAALATASLAVSLPFFYLSRNMYTEPLTVALVFSGLTLLWYALQSQSRALWLLSGVALGSGVLARIDAYLPIAAVEVFLIVWLMAAPRQDRQQCLMRTGLLMLPVAATALLSWLDLWLYSSGYLYSLQSQYRSELGLIVGLVVLGTANPNNHSVFRKIRAYGVHLTYLRHE